MNFQGKQEKNYYCEVTPFGFKFLKYNLCVLRNVLKLEKANSSEVDPKTPHPLIIDMPEHNQGQMGGTMRLGKRKTVFTSDKSIMSKYISPFIFLVNLYT